MMTGSVNLSSSPECLEKIGLGMQEKGIMTKYENKIMVIKRNMKEKQSYPRVKVLQK